jgi:hypothetical protein
MTDAFTLVYGKSVYAPAKKRDVGRGRCCCGRLELPAKTPHIPLFQFLLHTPTCFSTTATTATTTTTLNLRLLIGAYPYVWGIRPILPWLKEKQEKRAPPCRVGKLGCG